MFDCALSCWLFFIQDLETEGEKDGSGGQFNGHHDDEELNQDREDAADGANSVYPTMRSEDSGLGISASPSEQHLSPRVKIAAEENGISKEGEAVWRRGGSVDTMTQCLQDILAFITTR